MNLRRLSVAIAPAALVLLSSLARAAEPVAPHVAVVPPVVAPHVAPPAAPPALTAGATAREWALKNNFPVRDVMAGPENRRVNRVVVPVTPDTWGSFIETFGNAPRTVVLKLTPNDNHLVFVFRGKEHLWARDIKPAGNDPRFGTRSNAPKDNPTGPAMVVELSETQASHLSEWLAHRANPNDGLWYCGAGCMDWVGNAEVGPGADGANTLRPISAIEVQRNPSAGKGGPSASIPAGQTLFDILGIARSKDGRNMAANGIHGANELLQVVAIPVGPNVGGVMKKQVAVDANGRRIVQEVLVGGSAVDRFVAMTDAELLGPPPAQGLAAVVRPAK